MKPLVVSFHTPGEPYPTFARRLAASCARHGLDCRIDELPDRGAWVENVAARGPFLWERMEELDRPLLWIDADGEVEAEPVLLYGAEADFAVHTIERGWEFRPVGREPMTLPAAWPRELGPRWFLGGTLFFRNTPAAKELLELWAGACRDRPRAYQQWLLQEAWCRVQGLRACEGISARSEGVNRAPLARRGDAGVAGPTSRSSNAARGDSGAPAVGPEFPSQALKTLWLPQGYCKIRGHRWREGEERRTVIAHDLASAVLQDPVRA